MKIVSGFFRFIAVVLMILVAVGLPLTLLSRCVVGPLLSADWMNDVFDAEMLANLAEYSFQQSGSLTLDSATEQFVQEALGQMTHEEWVGLMNIIAPQEVISEVTEQAKTGFEDLTSGSDRPADIVINIQPIKQNMLDRGSEALGYVLGTLPACTAEELVLLTAYGAGLTQEIPVCQPPEPIFSIMVSQGVAVLPAQVGNLPNEISLSIAQAGGDGSRIANVLQLVNLMRSFSQFGWLVLLLVYLVAIPLGARSLSGVFKWAGWPSLLAGVHALLLGLFMQYSHASIASMLTSFPTTNMPDEVIVAYSGFVNGILAGAARPMLFAAGGMIVWGVIALVVVTAIPGNKNRAEFQPY